jgi:hypothetical protein
VLTRSGHPVKRLLRVLLHYEYDHVSVLLSAESALDISMTTITEVST